MKKGIYIVSCLFIVFTISFLFYKKNQFIKNDHILYSWNHEKVLEDKMKFYDILNEYQITILYQDFSKKYLNDLNDSFIKEMNDKNIIVYHLAGSPNWGMKDGFLKMKEEIDRVVLFNSKVTNKIKGIVFDIEPYVSEKEEKFEKKDFKIYVNEIKKAYQYIKEKGLELVLAIPYWFDSIDIDLLEELVQNTDGISVMNYHIDKTSEHIENEIKLALKYNKKIDTIYEINYQDKKYFSSLEDILKDYEQIKEENGIDILGLSFHHYGSI